MELTLERLETEILRLPIDIRAKLAQKLLSSVALDNEKIEKQRIERLSPWAHSLLGIAKTEFLVSDEEIKHDYVAYLEKKYF
jgi:hypothetical protein